MDKFIEISKAVSDPNRVRSLMALRDRELCVCRIIELLHLAPSTVSKHLTILKQAGLIEGRKEGRWMHYRLSDNPSPATKRTLKWVFESLGHSREIKQDQERLAKIIETDIAELTRIYRKQG